MLYLLCALIGAAVPCLKWAFDGWQEVRKPNAILARERKEAEDLRASNEALRRMRAHSHSAMPTYYYGTWATTDAPPPMRKTGPAQGRWPGEEAKMLRELYHVEAARYGMLDTGINPNQQAFLIARAHEALEAYRRAVSNPAPAEVPPVPTPANESRQRPPAEGDAGYWPYDPAKPVADGDRGYRDRFTHTKHVSGGIPPLQGLHPEGRGGDELEAEGGADVQEGRQAATHEVGG